MGALAPNGLKEIEGDALIKIQFKNNYAIEFVNLVSSLLASENNANINRRVHKEKVKFLTWISLVLIQIHDKKSEFNDELIHLRDTKAKIIEEVRLIICCQLRTRNL